jgi:hypothetical protein
VQPVERADRHQLDVERHAAARQRPQFVQAIGIGDHGRPAVEGEAVALPVISAPARLVAALDKCGRYAGRSQADGERKPTEAGADHCRFFH